MKTPRRRVGVSASGGKSSIYARRHLLLMRCCQIALDMVIGTKCMLS